MTDLATLGLSAETSGLEKGTLLLKSVPGAAKAAETAAKGFTASMTGASAAAARMSATVEGAAASEGLVTTRLTMATSAVRANSAALEINALAAGKARMQSKQLMFQLVDIGQAIPLLFQSPLYGLQNLGFQIAQIGQLYAGEGGLTAALKDSIGMVGRFISRFAKVGLIIGVVTTAIFGMQHAINATSKTSVSFWNVTVGVFQALRDVIYNMLKPAIGAISPWFQEAWDAIVSGVHTVGNLIINSFRASFSDVKFIWNTLPEALSVAGKKAANGFIAAVEWMVQKALDGFNKIIKGANKVVKFFGGDWVKKKFGWDLTIPEFGKANLGRMDVSGANLSAANTAHAADIANIMNSDPLGDFYQDVRKHSIQNALDAAKKKHHGKTDAERMAERYDKITQSGQNYISSMEAERKSIGMTDLEAAKLTHTQELLNRARQAGIKLTPDQVTELTKLGSAMGTAEVATRKAKETFEFAKDATKGFMDDLRQGLQNGEGFWKSFGNAALNVLDKIVDKIENELIDAIFSVNSAGSGGKSIFGSLLSGIGSLFGFGGGGLSLPNTAPIPTPRPGFANGTSSAPAGWAWVGEQGPELRKLRAGDVIRSHSRSMQMVANNNTPPVYNDNRVYHIDARGQPDDVGPRIKQALAEYDREVAPQTAKKAVNASYNAGRNIGRL